LFEPFQGCAAINVRASLDNRDLRSGASQAPSDERAGNAGAYNQDVALLGHKSRFQRLEGAEAQRSGPPLQVLGGGSSPAARHIKVVS
jgi:hypothetical protein